jgi:hypothetical protein
MKGLLDIAGILNVGELNYIISNLLNTVSKSQLFNYNLCNGLIGVLECAKLELYNRLITPYEDIKIQENGGLYH